jgi:hypothetical protein
MLNSNFEMNDQKKIIENDILNEIYLTTEHIPEYSTVVFYKDTPNGVEVLLTKKNIPPSFENNSFEVLNISDKNPLKFKIDLVQVIEHSSEFIFEKVNVISYNPIRLLLCSLFIIVKVDDYKLKSGNVLISKSYPIIENFFEEWINHMREQIDTTESLEIAVF